MDGQGRLRIYLNDHLATTVVARELAARSAKHNRSSELGRFLSTYLADNERERALLLAVMGRVGASRQPYKEPAAWIAEHIGRLKLNGQLRGYSPLSRLVEIESLLALIRGSRSLWIALEALADPRLSDLDLRERALQATRHGEQLERIGLDAVIDAIGDRQSEPPTPPTA